MDIFIVSLRLIHIVGGSFWVGAAILLAAFVEPAASAAGPAGGQYMQRLAGSKMGVAITIAAVLTVVCGFLLYWRLGYSLGSVPGVTLLVGGIVGLISLVYGGAITGPTTLALGRVGAEIQASGKPPTPEQAAQMQTLQGRLRMASRINAALVTIAVITMAVARYL